MTRILQCHTVRFETRGREYILVARLKFCSQSESDKPAVYKGRSMKVLEVTGSLPEAS